ncbi:hypothetical protein ACHQM5_027002 [Ranunculus cassubicifolius]
MNTDITTSVKPEYPVVDRNPPFTKTVANFNTRLSPLHHHHWDRCHRRISLYIKPNIRGPSMMTGGLIGLLGGFMYAYQNSAGRLIVGTGECRICWVLGLKVKSIGEDDNGVTHKTFSIDSLFLHSYPYIEKCVFK